MSRTVVFLHAHPDDETLLTGGTMARLAAEGHRVVLVTATAGEAGLAAGALSAGRGLGDVRSAELARSAQLLGCARVVVLGYPDSGSTDDAAPGRATFAGTPIEEPAARVAEVLIEEAADAVVIYDPAGGYGHRDHVQVHHVGRRAAELAGTRVVLEATVDRRLLQRALRVVRCFGQRSPDFRPARFDALYADPDRITHRVDVRPYLGAKRAAMQAHASQSSADADAQRTIAWMLRLPRPLYRLAFGAEWFVEYGRDPGARRLDDLLASLRG